MQRARRDEVATLQLPDPSKIKRLTQHWQSRKQNLLRSRGQITKIQSKHWCKQDISVISGESASFSVRFFLEIMFGVKLKPHCAPI
jgi:hypothetical protein